MSETNINAQEAAFNAWIAELPERKDLMSYDELYQMICDKVGKADRETMAEWLRQLGDKVGVASTPYIWYRWWQRWVSDPEMTIYMGDTSIELADDGSHKWRYITNLRQGEEKEDTEFILRNLGETAELRLRRSAWGKDGAEGQGYLSLRTATISVTFELNERDSNALSLSVQQMMDCRGISEPQERQITEIYAVFPRSYTATEQIYSSPFLYLNDPVAEAEMVRTGQIKSVDWPDLDIEEDGDGSGVVIKKRD